MAEKLHRNLNKYIHIFKYISAMYIYIYIYIYILYIYIYIYNIYIYIKLRSMEKLSV